MIDLLEINEFELKKYVEAAYQGDEDLLNYYHIDKYDFDGAVKETLNMIEQTSVGVNMKYFGVQIHDEKIGYICAFQNNLYSFGVNIKYRNKWVLIDFWENIKTILGNNFMTVLYPNNTRAINWAKRCGMQEQQCVVLLYNN